MYIPGIFLLCQLRKLSCVNSLSLKLLTFKLVMLPVLALTLASHTQSLYLHSFIMKKGFSSYTLTS